MHTPDSDEVNAFYVELAQQQASSSTDFRQLREVRWMFRVAMVLLIGLFALASVKLDDNLSLCLSTYTAAVAIGVSGWGFVRTLLDRRKSQNQSFYVPNIVAFGALLLGFTIILLVARTGDWHFGRMETTSGLRKK